MPPPAGVVPVQAVIGKKRAAADRADQRAARLRGEADLLEASKAKKTP